MISNDDRAVALTPMVHVDPAVAHRAALYVAGHCQDAEDCRDLLDALGLLGRPLRSSRQVSQRNRRRKTA